MKKQVYLILAALALTACAKQAPAEPVVETIAETTAAEMTEEATADETEIEAEAADFTSGHPWIDANIEGAITASTSVELKDDYYLAVNKDRILELEYAPGESSRLNLMEESYSIDDNKLALVKDTEAESYEGKLLNQFYQALDDWDSREKEARKEAERMLAQIDGLESMADYCAQTYDWRDPEVMDGLVDIGLGLSSDDSSVHGAIIHLPGLTLGDAAEYTERTGYGEMDYNIALETYLYALEQMDMDTAAGQEEFERMIEFETGIAAHSMTMEQINRAESIAEMDNYMSIEEIDELLGDNYDFRKMLEINHFVPERPIKVGEPELLRYVGEIFSDETQLDALKNYLKVRSLSNMVADFSKEAMLHVRDISNAWYGITEQRPYELQLMDIVDGWLNEPMQAAYIERYATEESKEKITKICEEIIDEYAKMLEETDWISEETRAAAIEKLNKMQINAVYPDKLEDFSNVELEGKTLYEMLQAIGDHQADMACERLNNKVDPEEWLMDCTITNAGYYLQMNSINILLGILGEETYTDDMAIEEVYGRIGMVIAHEISHAFDSGGSQYDGDGNLVSWWTQEDKAEFDKRVGKVRKYFDGISIYGDKYLSGTKLDGEATADITGVTCLLRLAEQIPDFDYDVFFRSLADMWAMKALPSYIEYLYLYDVHPPAYTRVNAVLQQFDAFLDTYDIREGDGMYLAPEERICVW